MKRPSAPGAKETAGQRRRADRLRKRAGLMAERQNYIEDKMGFLEMKSVSEKTLVDYRLRFQQFS